MRGVWVHLVNYNQAATLLNEAAALLAGDALALNVAHLARACQLRARVEAATVHVELHPAGEAPITILQDGQTVRMQHQQTGEKREISLDDFARIANVNRAWRHAREG